MHQQSTQLLDAARIRFVLSLPLTAEDLSLPSGHSEVFTSRHPQFVHRLHDQTPQIRTYQLYPDKGIVLFLHRLIQT